MKIYTLSKRDTVIIKGFGILLITMHNFFHWISPSPGENEFSFSSNYLNNFFQYIILYPDETINLLFSYLGHYGVQLFLFISGYGLTMSFIKNPLSWGSFIVDRLKKLYPLLFTGIIVFFIYAIIVNRMFLSISVWKELLYKILFVHTLLPKSGMGIIGPWWFFGLIFQMYLLFPILLRIIQKYQIKGYGIICTLAYTFIFISQYEFQKLSEIPFLENAPGHLPEFCLGIYFALNKKKMLSNLWLIISIILFCLGNFFHLFYPFTFLSITIIFLFIYPYILHCCKKLSCIESSLMKLGSLSMLIFATHAPFRDSMARFFETTDGAIMHLFGAVIYFITIYCIAVASKVIYDVLIKLLSHIPTPTKIETTMFEKLVFGLICVFFAYVVLFYVFAAKPIHTPQIVQPSTYCNNDTVNIENNYFVLARYDIPDNSPTIDIQIEFEYKCLNNEYPDVVIDISNFIWNDYSMKSNSQADFKHYTYQYTFYRPVMRSVKGKQLSVILRTSKETHGVIKNVNIQVKK